MYLDHFGLSEAPFKITPNTGFFYAGADRGAILDALLYAIEQGEGIIKVTGEVGSGKTMLCRMLAEKLRGSHDLVYLANPHIAPREVLAAIAFDLKLDMPAEASLTELTHAVTHSLLTSHSSGRRTVLLIEEAQGMPLETLEEVRLLTNLETAHEKLLQIVLFGQPELDDNLRQPSIRQLNERITQHFMLRPLTQEEARQYLDHRLRSAGYRGPELFSPLLVHELNRHAGGLSRRLNILADKALLAAYAENTHTVTLRHIRAAAADCAFSRPALFGERRQLAIAGLILLAGLGLAAQLGLFRSAAPAAAAASVGTAPTRAVSATVAAAPPTALNPVEARLQATRQWLNSSPDTTLTLQLFSEGDSAQLAQHLLQFASIMKIEQVFVYRTRIRNKPYYTVTYGSYHSRPEALAAIAQLPGSLKKNRPLIRTVGGIRAEQAAAAQGAGNL